MSAMKWLELRAPPIVVLLIHGVGVWLLADEKRSRATLSSVPGASGAVLVMIGGLIAGTAVWQFRDSRTTVDPRRPGATTTMVTGGVYRWTRNPMYLAFALLLAGWACLLGAGRELCLIPVFVLYVSRFQIRPEERALEDSFGVAYREYAGRVRRWI